MKRILILSLTVVCLFSFLIFNVTRANAVSRDIDNNIQEIMDKVERMAIEDPAKASSSNPYTYVTNDPNYSNIVKLGSKALPVIKDKISISKENGLKEYILAIAAEEIAKVDLKKDSFKWSTGKEWVQEWDKHLKNIPSNISSIISSNSSNEVKVNNLIKLGTPAIPFIMDRVEQGQVELVPALEELLRGNDSITFDKTHIADFKKWSKENKPFFSDLRTMVENANK